MSELPQPDVMDRGGRMRRLVMSFVVGVVVAASVYMMCYAVIPKSEFDHAFEFVSKNMSAVEFVDWLTAVSGAVAFAITLAVTTTLAKRRWRQQRDVPPAKQVS